MPELLAWVGAGRVIALALVLAMPFGPTKRVLAASLGFLFGISICPLVPPDSLSAGAVLSEALLGASAGVLTLLLFHAGRIASATLRAASALWLASPQLLSIAWVALFLTLGGLDELLIALIESYELLPPGEPLSRDQAFAIGSATFALLCSGLLPLLATAAVVELLLEMLAQIAGPTRASRLILGQTWLILCALILLRWMSKAFAPWIIHTLQSL